MIRWKIAVVLVSVAMVVAACGGSGGTGASRSSRPLSTAGGGGTSSDLRIGEIMTGPVSDNSWNYRQSIALKLMESKYDAKTTYIESVPVADASQDAQQLVSNGYNVIIFNSPAFFNSALQLARQNSNITVIAVSAALSIPDQPRNLWLEQAKFAPADYVMGYAAALVANGPKVCYLGGVELPNIIAGANATLRGAKAANASIGGEVNFTGDFDDPAKARLLTSTMINNGCGAFVLLLDDATKGVVQAIKASGKRIPWFSYNSDQSSLDPATYGGGYTFDWDQAYTTVVGKIRAGIRSGSYDLSTGFKLFPLYNMTNDQRNRVQDVYKKVIDGAIKVDSTMTDKVVIP
ncbi:MAG: BMP family ABC transporter substrate-binding protein [Acidothermus cellulolyticus]|nr:BMP family ABC transporter substrate-binding protein [Acidothermus cellulolyticus]